MKKLLQFVVPILLAVLLVASIGWYLFIFDREFTRDMLLKEARINDTRGSSKISAWFYNLAYEQSGKDENVAIELANQYKSDGNYTKAEVTLSNAINSGATAELYTALCRTYVEQDKLMDAVALLNNIPNDAIRAELDALRPTTPNPGQQPGFYSQYIKLELSTSSGTILYTTNGEYPSIKDTPYTEPISLPSGESILYCISVDETGLVSPLTVLGYTIGGVIEPAVFQDPNMELAVREVLGMEGSAVLYTNNLWEITEFTVPVNVYDMTDLALLPFVEKLTVNYKQLENLNQITVLTKLKELDLTGCRFPSGSLSSLLNLPNLSTLILADCGISTIADLDGMEQLKYLDISENTVRNLDVLTGMPKLQELHMQHNAIISLEAIAPLANLEKLDVSYNSLTTLAPIASCARLTWINAAYNQLTGTEGVASLPLVTSLSLSYNQIYNIADLSACIQLDELSISNNLIRDISYLAGLTRLEIFDFSRNSVEKLPDWPDGCALRVIEGSHNSISNIDILSKMDNLTYVSMDYNHITNVDALAECNNLVQVNVYGNEIESVSELTAHNIIVNYDPT